MDVIALSSVKGQACLHYVGESPTWSNNLVLYSWQTILAGLLLNADNKYRLNAMYLEFENTASPGDPITPPTFTRERGLSYYDNLVGHPSRDYLRVGLLGTAANSENNVTELTFFASSVGAAGIHGKPFSNAANSTVIGGSLVAAPVSSDRTQDILFSSIYFSGPQQKLKLANSDIGLAWKISLE